jgi:class 3 adenylate cyclase
VANVETEQFGLYRFGLRFREPAVEREFVRWYVGTATSFSRLALVASYLGWIFAWAGSAFGLPRTAAPMAPWILGVIFPLLALALAWTWFPGRAMLLVSAFANCIAGVVAVHLSFSIIRLPEASSLSVVIIAFFAFTIFRLPPLVAAAAVAVYFAAHQVHVIHGYRVGDIDAAHAWLDSVMPWVAFAIGVLVCCVQSRNSRESYRQERVIGEQARVIARERERSEDLLRNMLPSPIANRLKSSDAVVADHFAGVTVLFADIVNFTELSTRMSPRRIVEVLDHVFTRFDEITAARGAEKIKTVGDAYMAVAGAPEIRADHVEVVADLALDLRDEISSLGADLRIPLTCRIGIASGPAVAGVIGRSRFAYDLWGHTVNMAARMESHSEAGRILVTAAVHNRLRATHLLEATDARKVKGVGTVPGWYLEARRESMAGPIAS